MKQIGKSLHQKIFLISILIIGQFANANDSTTQKPILNIMLLNETGKRPFLKLYDAKISMVGGGHNWRYFYQLQLRDTGVFKFYLYTVTALQSKLIPKNEKTIDIPIKFTGERWWIVSTRGKKLKKIKSNPIHLLTTDEFQKEYPKAYKRFKRISFNKVFKNLQVNVEPNKNED